MDGLWTVEFGSNAGVYGTGVAVLRQGKIEGGDASYYYLGSYEPVENVERYPAAFRAKLSVKPYVPNAESVFKTFNQDVTLLLEGTLNNKNSAVAVGTPEGISDMNLGVRLTRRAD